MDGPLSGIRIIDWTIWQQGPAATTTLADLGAEVIKLEERERGDPGRLLWAHPRGPKKVLNFFFEANNRHKKSVALDLKRPEAREIVYRLVAKSDVFVQNFRKGVAKRLGFDYAALSVHNPRLIYASASGFGLEGPDSGDPSFDYLGQSRSGIMQTTGGPEDPPSYVVAGIADEAGASMLAFAIVTALLVRERRGIGQEVDASLLGAMTMLQRLNVAARAMTGREMRRDPRATAANPLWNHYRCADGKWLSLGMPDADRYWRDFCGVLGLGELVDDPRFANYRKRAENAAELVAILDRKIATRARDEWLPVLKSGGMICSILNSISDLVDDPQVVANEYIVDYEHPEFGKTKLVGAPIKFARTRANPRGHAPELGQHTEAVLAGILGYGAEDIARLREAGVI
jgi:crotonobetainyl-CoA:carnitine CoA-transferase CaiB-like acyl-CoA transferase